MIFLSKAVAFLLDPLVWVVGLLLVAVGYPGLRPAARRGWSMAALLLLLGLGLQAVPDSGVRALEAQYAEIAPETALEGFAGVIVLGGATESGRMALSHRQPGLNSGAERLTAAQALARRYPQWTVVYTGGEGQWMGSGPSEAERARIFFESQGLPPGRLRYEDISRNTHENAVLTARLSGIDPQKRWLLLTSAWHMPRAMATFEKAGWNVQAYPVDFRTADHTDWYSFNLTQAVEQWGVLLRERVGWLVYRMAGRL